MRYLMIMGFVLGLIMLSFESLYATTFTPLEWQYRVEKSFDDHFVGQRKHTTWVRDRNRNFIDDIIDKRLKKDKKFDIIVDLNTFLTIDVIKKKFDRYGHVKYIGKMITFILLNNVKAQVLSKIVKMDEVAMIEIQQNFKPALNFSARAVQARACQTCPYSQAAHPNWTGSGINIAIIDTGVDDAQGVDGEHEQFEGKFVAGFDATIFEDDFDHDGVDDSGDELADGMTNPDDDWDRIGSKGHGTYVAGIALGKGVENRYCRAQSGEQRIKDCAGVAPGAGLVDIKVCANNDCIAADIIEAMDWLGFNYEKFNIRVANISLTYGIDVDEDGIIDKYDDDGKSAIAQQVNYLSSLGIVMVAAHGNAIGLPIDLNQPGTPLTQSPGSASFAVTVSGTNDQGTIPRSDDDTWDRYLVGPRSDFYQTSDILALKPDISAPAQGIYSAKYNTINEYWEKLGTSIAAPHVSGAAAIILEARKNMNPGSVKNTLIQSADNNQNTRAILAMPPAWNWDEAFGWGMLNVRAAIDLVATTDVGFPTCSGPPNSPGSPCTLSGGLPSWNNNEDISTLAPPQVGVPNEIRVAVENLGPNNATFLVNFGVYIFAVGNNQFFHIGTRQVSVNAGLTEIVSHPWTPESSDHQCVQVSIDYGLDTNFDNNITQRNLSVSPSVYNVRVENPFAVPAAFRIEPKSLREGWDCRVKDYNFQLHPYLDPPKIVQITFDPPKDSEAGERANCDVAIFAKPKGKKKEILIGGVTVQTFVPEPCRIIGWIRDKEGKAIPGAEVIIGPEQQPIKALSDKYGFVSLEGTPYRPQLITVITKKYGKHSIKNRLYCGAGTFEILVTEKGLTIETHQRRKDWAWDLQLGEGYKPKRKTK